MNDECRNPKDEGINAETLRNLLNSGPVVVSMTNGEQHTLQSPGNTIVSDFEVVTLVNSERGLRASMLTFDNIASATRFA